VGIEPTYAAWEARLNSPPNELIVKSCHSDANPVKWLEMERKTYLLGQPMSALQQHSRHPSVSRSNDSDRIAAEIVGSFRGARSGAMPDRRAKRDQAPFAPLLRRQKRRAPYRFAPGHIAPNHWKAIGRALLERPDSPPRAFPRAAAQRPRTG